MATKARRTSRKPPAKTNGSAAKPKPRRKPAVSDAERIGRARAPTYIDGMSVIRRVRGEIATVAVDDRQFNPLLVIDPDAKVVSKDLVPLARKPETDQEWLQSAAARGIQELGGQGFVNRALAKDPLEGLKVARDILKEADAPSGRQIQIGIKVIQNVDLSRV